MIDDDPSLQAAYALSSVDDNRHIMRAGPKVTIRILLRHGLCAARHVAPVFATWWGCTCSGRWGWDGAFGTGAALPFPLTPSICLRKCLKPRRKRTSTDTLTWLMSRNLLHILAGSMTGLCHREPLRMAMWGRMRSCYCRWRAMGRFFACRQQTPLDRKRVRSEISEP